MQFVKLMATVTTCLVARSAAAQPTAQPAAQPARPAAPPAPSQSVLPNMLPLSAGATIDTRIDATRATDGTLEGATLFALNLHGQMIMASGLGVYLSLPLAFATGDGDREAELGNLELGGLYVAHGRHIDAYLRGGVARKETSTEGDLLPVLANVIPRPADAIATGLGASWLRSEAGLRVTIGSLVVGGSGGVDVAASFDGKPASIIHLSGSIGIARPRFGIALGATLLQPLLGGDGLFGLQAIADTPIGARMRLYSAFGFSLEDDVEAFSVGAGLRVGI